jgi:hypothetical protein
LNSRQVAVVEDAGRHVRAGVHGGERDDDHARTALCPLGEVGDEAVSDGSVGFRIPHGHGQHNDAIPDFQVSDASGGEQVLEHFLLLSI